MPLLWDCNRLGLLILYLRVRAPCPESGGCSFGGGCESRTGTTRRRKSHHAAKSKITHGKADENGRKCRAIGAKERPSTNQRGARSSASKACQGKNDREHVYGQDADGLGCTDRGTHTQRKANR